MAAQTMVLPAIGTVLAEQVRTVGLAVRREGLLFTAAMVALVAAVAAAALVPSIGAELVGELPPRLNPEKFGFIAALIGLAFPLAVWKNEAPWGDTTLWALPVSHTHHALVKIAAGWLWLIVVLAIGTVALCAAALIAGGELGVEVTRLVLADPGARLVGGSPEGPETFAVVWSTPAYQWLMPFTGGTVVYLFASALWVGTRHPLRWAVVLWLGALTIAGFFELTEVQPIERLAQDGLHGIDLMLTSGFETMRTGFRGQNREWTQVWTTLPSAGGWAAATAAWLLAGLGAVLAAARRHRRR